MKLNDMKAFYRKIMISLFIVSMVPVSAQVTRKQAQPKNKKSNKDIEVAPNTTAVREPLENANVPNREINSNRAENSDNFLKDDQIGGPYQSAGNDPIVVPDVRPSFPGGDERFKEYLMANMEFPERCSEEGLTAVVTLSFVVDRKGVISNIQVEKANGSCPEFTNEAVRLLKKSPKWIPGQKAGKFVTSKREVNVEFYLAEGEWQEPEMDPVPREVKSNDAPKSGSPATFPGGEAEFLKYVQKRLVYPVRCKDAQIQGKVLARFIVDVDGRITNVEILEHVYLCPEFSKEVTRVMLQSPKWIAAQLDGKAVKSYQSIPIQFKLEER